MKSYVIGFILSLVFTFIPYYLVVNRSITGNLLLATIIGIAVLQMVIQITFFLHLGRGPKPNWNLFFFISTVGIILVVVGGSIMIINNLHYNMLPSDQTKRLTNDEAIYQIGGLKTGACQGQHANHKVTIKNGQVSPLHTLAYKCDTLTFINEDDTVREITFGTHPQHGVYAGENELVVRKGRGKSITLSEPGTYQFHDHLRAETAGDFTVFP
ncbi:MAG: cytochrome o ubiquinol oxidase subunit IV [Patescibacteria group bacterium]